MSNKDPKVDAIRYILFGLIQRLEENQPGLLEDMIEGIKGDQQSSNPPEDKEEHINQVFTEALKTLEQAKALLDDN